jgi:hypothetical protein
MRWNWSHNAVAPALLVLGEAAWATMWCNFATRGSHPGLPVIAYFAFAVPAVIAVAAGSGARFVAGRGGWTAPIVVALAVAAVIGVALTAGSLGAVFGAGSVIRVATEPWTLHGSLVILAFALAIAAWGRGLWLAVLTTSTARVVHSAVWSLVSFVTFVTVLRFDRHGARGTSVGACIAWLVFCFLADLFVATIVRESELSLVRRGRSIRRIDRAWIVILGGAALVIVVLALVAAALSGPGETVAAWPLDRVRHGTYVALAWLLGQKDKHSVSQGRGGGGGSLHIGKGAWIGLLAVAVAAFVALMVLWIRHLRHHGLPRFRPGHEAKGEDEDRESIFSWRHVLSQLLGLFRWRRHRGGVLARAGDGSLGHPLAGPGGVRGHYLRFLAIARTEGLGRGLDETTRELEHRVSDAGEDSIDLDLVGLTELYERVRYGDEPESAEMADLARRRSERVVEAITAPHALGSTPGGG